MRFRFAVGLWVACLLSNLSLNVAHAQDEYDLPPIEYSKTTAENPVARLDAQIAAGKTTLEFRDGTGYLQDFLKALDIPVESQMLVFSKTSLLHHRITPQTPRAFYFNADVYVGSCQKGEMLEIAVADPKLGAVFYALDQKKVDKPQIQRQGDNCLSCHNSSRTAGVPGFFVRSLYVDPDGQPIFSAGSRSVDHTTPLADRWGGWYVTGKHGAQTHLGNLIMHGRVSPPVDNAQGQNVTNLADRLAIDKYLTPHSDIVALMVLEHQVLVHNRITKANYVARQAAAYEAEWNRTLGQPEGTPLESVTRRIKNAGDALIDALLFVRETKLTAPISGTSGFAKKFAAQGPRDYKGRSLREFDLETRMFKYPCSYLIYSPTFDALPKPMLDYVYKRLWEVLTADQPPEQFGHLTKDDRRAIAEIVIATKRDLPDYWKLAK
jgi:hypothetical protein